MGNCSRLIAYEEETSIALSVVYERALVANATIGLFGSFDRSIT